MNPPQLPTDAYAAQQPPQRSGLAMASLILGICGIVLCLGPAAGIPAVICGHVAQSKIRQAGGRLTGTGLATAGLVTGYISITLVFVIGMLAAIAIPNFVRARQQAQTVACQSHLRAIQGAKEVWALENKKASEAVPADSDLFGPSKPMAEKPVCPAGGTYTLNAAQDNPVCSIHGSLANR